LAPPAGPLEREIKNAIITFLRDIGCKVYNLDQGFRPGGPRHGTTRQTKGLGDLYAIMPSAFPSAFPVLWIEVKRRGNKRSPEQDAFAVQNRARGIYVLLAYSTLDVIRFVQSVREWAHLEPNARLASEEAIAYIEARFHQLRRDDNHE
jgi:hypothetical protein